MSSLSQSLSVLPHSSPSYPLLLNAYTLSLPFLFVLPSSHSTYNSSPPPRRFYHPAAAIKFSRCNKNFPFLPRGRRYASVCVCVRVPLCMCVFTQILNFLVFYFPSLRCFAFLLCSALHFLFCFGISVYFFQRKIYVKCSGNGAAGVGVGVTVAVSVDVEIVTDAAAAVAVSFNGVKKQNCQKSTSL